MELTYFRVNIQKVKSYSITESGLEKITREDREDNIYVIKVDGIITKDTYMELCEAMSKIKGKEKDYQGLKLYVDLEKCPRSSEEGLASLMSFYTTPIEERGDNPFRFRLANVNEEIMGAFELKSFSKIDQFGNHYIADPAKSLAKNVIEAFKDY